MACVRLAVPMLVRLDVQNPVIMRFIVWKCVTLDVPNAGIILLIVWNDVTCKGLQHKVRFCIVLALMAYVFPMTELGS